MSNRPDYTLPNASLKPIQPMEKSGFMEFMVAPQVKPAEMPVMFEPGTAPDAARAYHALIGGTGPQPGFVDTVAAANSWFKAVAVAAGDADPASKVR